MKYLIYILLTCATLRVQAQSGEPSEVPGKITGLPVNGVFKSITGSAAAVKTFNTTFGKLLNASMVSKLLAEPVGFEAKIFGNISKLQPQLGEERYTGAFNIFLFNYSINNAGTMKKVNEAPAYIKMYLNSTDFFSHTAGFFEAYDERFHIPHPFQKIPVTDSTEDYVEYSFKNYPFSTGYYADFVFRIVRGNDRPVFIPFTRKQYLEYLITGEKMRIKESDVKIADFKKQLTDVKKRLAEEKNADTKKILQTSVEGTENAITQQEEWIGECNDKINNYRTEILGMSAEEAKMTAYVDMDKAANTRTERMATPGRHEGYPLYIVNPDYYDDSKKPDKTQAVIVSYWYHSRFCPQFLQERTRRIFESIDYHQIKESMQ